MAFPAYRRKPARLRLAVLIAPAKNDCFILFHTVSFLIAFKNHAPAPTRRIRSGCCARAASGHKAAIPATILMKSRRLIVAPRLGK
jgi:hypothetical protein